MVKGQQLWSVVGLMSGTSTDGIDAAWSRIRIVRSKVQVEELCFATYAFAPRLRQGLLDCADGRALSAEQFARLHVDLGEAFYRAVMRILRKAQVPMESVDVIGSHGHTVFHGPPRRGQMRGATLQIGENAIIANKSGITTVGDFRPADVARGGQGAPLAPYAHGLLFRHPRRGRVVANIGGITNPTYIAAGGNTDPLFAFDSGPGNMIIDSLVQHFSSGRQSFDRHGRIAASGQVDSRLLGHLMKHPFLKRHPPKSTGREEFGKSFLGSVLAMVGERVSQEDAVATVTAFTSRSLGQAIRRFILNKGSVDEVFICGGGRKNSCLMGMLADDLAPIPVAPVDDLGVDGDSLEALIFAILAVESLRARPAALPGVTGADSAAILAKSCRELQRTFVG